MQKLFHVYNLFFFQIVCFKLTRTYVTTSMIWATGGPFLSFFVSLVLSLRVACRN